MVQWIQIQSTDTKGIEKLAEIYGVHHLAIEDCLHRDQRPKLDDYGNHQLLVWFMFCKGQIYELQFLIFPDKLILIPHSPPPIEATWDDFLKIRNDHKDVWHLLYHALDTTTDVTWHELRSIYSKVDEFEQHLFNKEIHPQELLKLKKQLNKIEYSIGHLSSVAMQLQNLYKPTDDLLWKLRDLHDHCERFDKSLLLYRGQIATFIELYWGLQANRTNKQIKKLSILASIAVPMTFWSSVWGMNFEYIPFEKPELFYFAIFMMFISVVLTVWFLVRKGYWSD
jgi:magnesium transporter